MRALFWLILASALGLYAVMLAWSIPTISTAAGGLPIFDMRPTGYDFAAATTFLKALSAEGRRFYLQVQHRLDLVYPPLLALATAWATLWLAPTGWRRAWPLLVAPAVFGAIFDLLENSAVTALLTAPLDQITPAAVARASHFSQLKAAFNIVSMLLVLLVLLLWAIRWRKARRRS